MKIQFNESVKEQKKEMTKLKIQVSNFTLTMAEKEKGKFTSQTEPKSSRQVLHTDASDIHGSESIMTISTLHSGKVLGDVPKTNEKKTKGDAKVNVQVEVEKEDGTLIEVEKDDSVIEVEKEQKVEEGDSSKKNYKKVDLVPDVTNAPFLSRFKEENENEKMKEIYEVFKQVNINIPLLDVVKQIPRYAKFLKDMCLIKRNMHVQKSAFMTETVSAIIQNEKNA